MRVLVTANMTQEGLRRLEELELEVIYDPWGLKNRIMMAEDLAARAAELQVDALIIEVDLCHEEVFEACDLKFIACCRGDPLNVDLDEATERGVPVFCAPGRNADAVADLAPALMLCHLRKVITLHGLLCSGGLDPESVDEFMAMFRSWTGFELGGKTVGIVGLGAVGAAVAKRVRAFGAPLLACDPFAPHERFEESGAKKAGLAELFKKSDIVTLHAADADDNQGMITKELIDSMKPDALFLNLARASLVDNDALYHALREQRIGGAGLDVFMSEPPRKDDRFLQLDNVIVTPHIGGATHDVIRHQTEIILEDIEAFLGGSRPRYCVNPEVLK